MYIKFLTVCTLLICLTFVPVNYPQEFQKCLTFSEEILNQNPLLARPLHNRPETQIPTDHFIVHFIDIELHPTDPDATNYGYAAFIATIAEQVWNKEVNQFGWPQPPGDGTIGGGTNKYDIYLLNLSDGYGYTKPEDLVPGTNGYTSYVVVSTGIIKNPGDPWRPMTADEIKATVAHEFNHALQDGLTWLAKQMNNNSWFYENTATWMEEICYPEVDDWILTFMNDPDLTTTCLKKPYLPIDHWGNTNDDQYQYSGALFCHTMSKWKGDTIIKNIWLRAKNTTVDFVYDIDYVLDNQYSTSLDEVLKRYAIWRYYTGDNDDGNHFDKASLMEGLHILREHNNGTGSGSSSPDNLHSKGGTSYIVFKNADGVVNINFDGQNNIQLTVIGLNKRIFFSDIENNFTLNSSNDGTINNQSCIGEDYVVLIPVVTDWQNTLNGITYSYSSTLGTGVATSFWTEKENTNISQGTLSVQLSDPIPSGNSRGLTNLLSYGEKANFERFPDFQGKAIKHNKWNLLNNRYFLLNDFEASIQNNRQSAKYEFLDYARIENQLEGYLIDQIGYFEFYDPWFVKSDGSQPGNYWRPCLSLYEPTGKEGATDKGVFLNQGLPNWAPPYYKIKLPQPIQNIYLPPTNKTHRFYFQGWNYDPNKISLQYPTSIQTGVVFKEANAVLTANLKGTQLSKDQSAYASGSQRKIIRVVKSGAPTTLHAVYESNGYCWYEMSTDNGQTWEIMNDGKPLSFAGYGDLGKGPSIEYSSSQGVIYIVWQGKNSYYNENRILFASFMPSSWYSTDYELQYLKIISPELNYSYEQLDANPVLAVGKYNWGLVVWKGTYNDNILNLKYKLGWFTSDYSPRSSGVIPQTDSYSLNPSIFGNKSGTIDDIFHLVYQKSFEIYYRKITHSGDQVNFNDPDFIKLSENNGFAKNYNPSIIGCFEGNNSYPKITWIAFRKTYIQDNPQGSGQQSLGETKVFCRSKNTIGWSAFSSYGSNINAVNINHNNDNTFAIAWSEALTSNYVNKFVRSDYPTEIYLANTSGKNLQVVNYDNLNNMRLNSFTTSTTPYSFSLSNTFYVIPHDIQYYMDGNIVQDTTTFYFRLGDILVGGQQVKFEDLPDGISIPDYETLNSYFISQPFTLTDNIDFIYSVEYGVTDSLSATMLLQDGKFAHFKVELIDDQSNELLGTFDDVTYNSENIMLYEKIAYQVNTQGIGNRICRLRLVTEDDLGLHYSISNCFNDQTDLGKLNLVQRTIDGVGSVKTYALEQNFPNPFNPTTVIKYQIPKAGNVLLKVYDILGSELATLVDEQKSEGRYEVNFDARNLASGIYIYRLSVNDFVNVKKMVLLK